MRLIYLLLLGTALTLSCCAKGPEKQDKSEIPDKQIPEPGSENNAILLDTTLQTKTGKAFQIIGRPSGESLTDLIVIGKGFEMSGDSIRFPGTDPLESAFLLDLDQDGFDEIYLVTSSVGSGSYAGIYGVASNKDLSYTPISVRQISEKDLTDESKFAGYMGHDSIFVSENQLRRKFPIYKEGDANCCPTGGHRTLSYSLSPGEAAWQLTIK